jgi:rhamnogalacturonan endolyase
MVAVDLKAGLNILYLKSLEENGAPNLDQIAFDKEGIVLFEDSTQLSAVDTLSTEVVAGDTSASTSNPADSSNITALTRGNIRLASGIYLNFAEGTLVAREAGLVQVEFFDMTGHRVAGFAKIVLAGCSNLGKQISRLPKGAYMVRVKFNGRILQNMVQVNLKY